MIPSSSISPAPSISQPPQQQQQHPARRPSGKLSTKHLLLGSVCAVLFLWWTSSGMSRLRGSSSSSVPPAATMQQQQQQHAAHSHSSHEGIPLGVLDDDDEEGEDDDDDEAGEDDLPSASSSSTRRFPKLLIQVTGHDAYIRRDLPMIRRGYMQARNNRLSFVRHPSRTPHLVLCLTVQSCLGAFDAGEPSNPNTRIVSRVPHLRNVLWSKKAFCESVPAWVASLVSFPCWVLPDSSLEIGDLMSSEGQLSNRTRRWIVKPHASGGGLGIFVVSQEHKMREILRSRRPVVVQPFLGNPMLVKRRKVDLRVYALLMSTSPLRLYVHSRGLVRFASQAYVAERAVETSPQSEDGDDSETTTPALVPVTPANKEQSKSQFLTNTSINKKTSKMTAAELTWSFQQLWDHMGEQRAREMRLKVDRSIALILLSVEKRFLKLTPSTVKTRRYQLLGVDVIFSDKPGDEAKVIEVNGEPSFEGSNLEDAASGDFAHYDETKIRVQRDVLTTVLAPDLPASATLASRSKFEKDGGPAEFAEYYDELEREARADTEFRLVYPSAANELSPHAGLAERALHDLGTKRVALHRYLVERELGLFRAHCTVSKASRECASLKGAVGLNGRADVFEDMVHVVVAQQEEEVEVVAAGEEEEAAEEEETDDERISESDVFLPAEEDNNNSP